MPRHNRDDEDDDEDESEEDEEEDEEEDRRPRRRSRHRDDYEEDDRPSRRPPRGRSFRCPYCDSGRMPTVTRETSQAGWIVFIVLLCFVVVGWPFCWLGLLMKEEKRACRDCGMKLG